MASPRYAKSFDSLDGTLGYSFPTVSYEIHESMGSRAPVALVTGAHYGLDLLGAYNRTLKNPVDVSVRFLLDAATPAALDTALDTLKSTVDRIGFGKLWSVGADGSERWCYARLVRFPEFTLTTRNNIHVPISMGFRRQSDWFGSALVNGGGPFTITAIDQVIVVNNPGNLPVTAMTIRVRANTATGINWPGMYITGQPAGIVTPWWYHARVGSTVNDEVKLDTGAPTAQWSTNDGGSYVDDYANFNHGYGTWFTLYPGNTSIVVTATALSTPRVNIEFSFYPAWA